MESSKKPNLQFEEENTLSKEEAMIKNDFLNQVNRGGLVTPTEVAYMACMHIYSFFEIIMKTEETKNILIKAVNPRRIFVNALEKMMSMSSHTESLLSMSCENGHDFLPMFLKISASLFNLMMKNFVSEMNSIIRTKPVKRSASNSPGTRKISKLKSSKWCHV